jgi:hypothetical protein
MSQWRLPVDAIEEISAAFLGSQHAVRLRDHRGRTSAQYSTVDHLRLERHVLGLLDATHTWNVARFPEIDHGGVVADQRTAEQAVLEALRRQPATAFAIHDAPSRARPSLGRDASLLKRAPGGDRPTWLDRVAEVARPSPPGHDPRVDLGS